MLGMNILDAMDSFFDNKAMEGKIDKQRKKGLSKFGAYVRIRARRSIRKRKRKAKPGQPPTSRTGLLKQFIFFVYEPRTESVLIGPAEFKESSDIPEVLEHGGTVERSVPNYEFVNGKQQITGYERKMVTYPGNPFMKPAFEDVSENSLHDIWHDSLK